MAKSWNELLLDEGQAMEAAVRCEEKRRLAVEALLEFMKDDE